MRTKRITERPLLVRTGRSAKPTSGGVRLFDDVRAQTDVVAWLLRAEQLPLLHAAVKSGPGAYALWYRGSHPLYRDLNPTHPVYLGKGAHVPERISSHRNSLREVHDLDPADFAVAVLSTTALVHAEVAEHLLNGAFNSRWCQQAWAGFGSRPRGSGRAQNPTNWDRIHPGRRSRAQLAQ